VASNPPSTFNPKTPHHALQKHDRLTRYGQTAGVVAIDGKTLRRSFDAASEKSALHMVSAWSCEERLVLAQIATDERSNEITAVPQLLRLLNLKGCTVTPTR
jgi:hypothetical protein